MPARYQGGSEVQHRALPVAQALSPKLSGWEGELSLVTAGGLAGFALYSVFVVLPHWMLTIPCTILLGLAFYLIHNPIVGGVSYLSARWIGSDFVTLVLSIAASVAGAAV